MNANSGFPQFSLRALLLLLTWSALVAALITRWGGAGLAIAFVLTAVVVACHPKMPWAGRAMALLPAVFVSLGWLVLSSLRGVRSDNPRGLCVHNERSIATGLLRYENEHQSFPPAFSTNELGAASHSWRTMLLPYFDRRDLYAQIHWDAPWSDPSNARLRQLDHGYFHCPSDRGWQPRTTSYVAIVGPGFVFQGATPVALTDIKDGPSQTLLFVEAASTGIKWMEPRDLRWEEIGAKPQPLSGMSNHVGQLVNATFADGHQHALPSTISAAHLHALLTIDGGEDISSMNQGESTR